MTASLAPLAPLALIGRWITFGGIFAAIGAVMFRFAVLGRAPSVADDTRRLAVRRAAAVGLVAVVVILPAAIARLVAQIAEMRFPDDPWFDFARRLVGSTAWGTVWITQVSIAVLSILAFALARRDGVARWTVTAVLVAALSITPTLSSHAMSADHWRVASVVADMLHIVCAGAWLGTLGVIFAVVSSPRDAGDSRETIVALVAAFSPLALISAAVVASSGLVSSLVHIEHIAPLYESTYGRTLLVKLAAVLSILVFGWFNWKRNTPGMLATGTAPIRRGMRLELIAAAVVLLLTALLVSTPPPMDGMAMP